MAVLISDRLRARLSEVGLSQSELARRAHITQGTIGGLLSGKSRSSSHLHVIARELGTTPAYLTGEVDDPDRDAPEPPMLTQEQTEWLAIFDALDVPNRAALMQIGRTMITGMNLPRSANP
ncbi:helix-turn-helix domain-containing protein [Sphingomonas sp. Leaf22]|uniref:helix-turn-helix domain-containing protein n=1 Tax=Sphingomonas sp. Leaf22 TaxID=1735687 RepID=UPI0009E90A89|nr:helix-turn-helix transcriptional regulator [Sphingomonas sp. Leaf22]